MRQERIDAIVPVLNGAGFLAACLSALRRAGFAADEIVVVDDGSSDGSAEIAESLGARVLRLDGSGGAGAARNAGAALSTADILFFVDADVEVHASAREVVAAFFADYPGHDAVFGAYDDDPAAPGHVSRARNLLHRFTHLENAGDIASFWTGCGAVRRRAFAALGGFSTDRGEIEDVEFGRRLAARGGGIRLLPALQGRHHKRWTLRSILMTDLFARAIPMARLLRRDRGGFALSVNNRARASVLSVGVALSGLAVAPFAPAALFAATGALAALAALNAPFLGYVRRLDGARALPGAFAMLAVHYFAGGLGFALAATGLDRLATGGHAPGVTGGGRDAPPGAAPGR